MDAILDAKWNRVIVLMFLLGEVICPASLFFAVLEPEMFRALDTSKLVMLSTSVALPIIVVNAVLAALALRHRRHRSREERDLRIISFAAAASVLPLYVPSLFHFFTGLGGIRTAVLIMIGAEAIVATLIYLPLWWCDPALPPFPCNDDTKDSLVP